MNASLLAHDQADNTTLDLAPVVPLDPGQDAPCEQWPDNRGPMPEQPDDDGNGDEWGPDDVISIPGESAADLPAADEIEFPPLVVDIFDKQTGERVGEQLLKDSSRQVYCTYFNDNSDNHIAIPRQLKTDIPPLAEAGFIESDSTPLDDDEEADCISDDDDLPHSTPAKQQIRESYAKAINAIGYGVVRVTYQPNATWYDSLDEGEQRHWPESRGNLYSWELLGDDCKHTLDIGKGCIKAQLIEQLEAEIVRLRKACATVRSIKGELTDDPDDFVRAAVADEQGRFPPVEYGPIVEGEDSLQSELGELNRELQRSSKGLRPAVVNVVTGEASIHRQPSPAIDSRLSWQASQGAGRTC